MSSHLGSRKAPGIQQAHQYHYGFYALTSSIYPDLGRKIKGVWLCAHLVKLRCNTTSNCLGAKRHCHAAKLPPRQPGPAKPARWKHGQRQAEYSTILFSHEALRALLLLYVRKKASLNSFTKRRPHECFRANLSIVGCPSTTYRCPSR